ncbi:Alpha/Beta hydrolase protein, partial [Lactarius hengduanensis]
LGAWFTFADPFYEAHLLGLSSGSDLLSPLDSRDDLIHAALRAHPTILFLYGTAGARTMRIRVQSYLAFAARPRANVLVPDFRGFADSAGTPSKAGVVPCVVLDARAARDWLRVRGAAPASVLVVRSSLGTGVAVQFASALEEADARDKKTRSGRLHGVVLLSPFSKLETLLDTYYILGPVPPFALLRKISYLPSEYFIEGFMIHRFDSLAKVVSLKAPLLIVHAEDDLDIPVWHAQMLFDAFLKSTCRRCQR